MSCYRKGVSFLSRIIGNKKKDVPSAAEDALSDAATSRMSIDTSHPIGFIPRHPAPSRYLRIRAHHKKDKKFHRVFLAQTLEGTGPLPKAERRPSTSTYINAEATGRAIWAVEFSKDGKYLAAAGQDRKVRVWATITTPEEREAAMRNITDADMEDPDLPKLKAPVFGPKPIQVFEGHEGSILDLSWSKVCVKTVHINRIKANRGNRITLSFPLPWTKLFDYGMQVDRNVYAASSTVILSLQSSSTPRMTGSSSPGRSIQSCAYGAFRTKASHT